MILLLFVDLALVGDCFLLGILVKRESENLFFLEFASSFFASLYIWKYLTLIFQIFKGSFSNIFASVAFLIALSQDFSSQPWVFNQAQIKVFRFFQKYLIKISSLGAIIGLNPLKIAYSCYRCATQSRIFSNQCQIFYLIFISQLLIKVWDFFKLWQKKTLNLSYLIKIKLFTSYFYLYYCQWNLICFQKKDIAKRI